MASQDLSRVLSAALKSNGRPTKILMWACLLTLHHHGVHTQSRETCTGPPPSHQTGYRWSYNETFAQKLQLDVRIYHLLQHCLSTALSEIGQRTVWQAGTCSKHICRTRIWSLLFPSCKFQALSSVRQLDTWSDDQDSHVLSIWCLPELWCCSGINKPVAVRDWLQKAQPPEDIILIIDDDAIMRRPLYPEKLGVKPGEPWKRL